MFVYIAGAGALGCRFGAALHQAGHEVVLLDRWPDHIAAISENGLKITGDREEMIHLPIMQPTEATRVADLVIILTKSQQLREMLSAIQPILGEETRVLCLLNGLGHSETLAEFVRPENILMGVTVWTAGLKGPGHVELKGSGSLTIQALGESGRDFGQQVANAFNEAGLQASYTDDVIHAIWKKAMINGTVNATCALLNCTLAELLDSPTAMVVVREILAEFIAIAEHDGCHFDIEETLAFVISAVQPIGHHYPSMHQDLVQNKRLTEIDYLNGLIAKRAEALGLEAPTCRLITQLVHAREEMNAR